MGDILSSLGIGGAESFSNSVDAFQAQNATIGDILGVGSTIPRTLGGIPGIGSRILRCDLDTEWANNGAYWYLFAIRCECARYG